MDDTTLDGLVVALTVTPDNAKLRAVVVEACVNRGEHQRAIELCTGVGAESFDPKTALLLASAYNATDAFDDALRLAALADSPEGQIQAARAHIALGQLDEARSKYREAVAANPTLENRDLDAQFNMDVPTIGDGRLRVVRAEGEDEEDELQSILVPTQEPIKFEDVGGLDEIKKLIHRRIILPFQKPALFKKFKRRIGGGILMYGPPGCGKTLLARATAGEVEANFMAVAISDVLDMYVGESERKLHALFERARANSPSVLFFDELEGLAGKRKYGREGHVAKMISSFLSEMDGFAQNNGGVLVLGATNVPWAIDPAFARPGRFDRTLFVPPPDVRARLKILELALEGVPAEAKLPLSEVAKRAISFSGADLRNVVETAVDEAIEASLETGTEVPVSAQHLSDALKVVKPTTIEWLTTARNYARYANEGGRYDEVLDFLNKHAKGAL